MKGKLKPPPSKKDVILWVRLSKDQKKMIANLAKENKMTLTDTVRGLIEIALE